MSSRPSRRVSPPASVRAMSALCFSLARNACIGAIPSTGSPIKRKSLLPASQLKQMETIARKIMEGAQAMLPTGPPTDNQRAPVTLELITHSIPYLILVLNYVLFQLLRALMDSLFSRACVSVKGARDAARRGAHARPSGRARLLKVLMEELVSTCELCADCAELNVVYEKHGPLAYGAALFVLSYLWVETFGAAHTTPGYLAEEYFLDKGNELLRTGDAYARFIGQSLAAPLAWRLASIYWRRHLLSEHSAMLDVENCRSSLTTSAWNGFLLELVCCLICRLAELCGRKLLERNYASQRAVSVACSFLCSLLVVLALELSGGYFNPILAASLELGCRGIEWHQHALVFWLGPLTGHVLARALFRRCGGERAPSSQPAAPPPKVRPPNSPARSSPRRRSRSDKID